MTPARCDAAGYLGWQVIDPGAPPLSPLIDEVPDTPDPEVQLEWRREVERANAKLELDHTRQPLWFPVQRPAGERFIPFFGGKPSSWQAACATLNRRAAARRLRPRPRRRPDAIRRARAPA